MAYPAMQARYAQAEESTASTLPDLGKPDRRNTTVNPSASGLALESATAGQKFRLAPEYSNLTGLAINAGFAAHLNDNAALGLLLTAGADKKELLFNAGYQVDGNNRLLFTLGQLRQNREFAFLSGNDKTELIQNSGAMSYQHRFGRGSLGGIEINAYLSNTGSRDLGNKTYATDTTTFYELWNEPRRIAGGKITGLQGQLTFNPIPGAALKLGLGGERLEYDFASGKDSTTRATGNAEWKQQFANGYSLNAALGTFAAQERYTLGLDRKLGGGHQVGVKLIETRGRDGTQNDSQALLAYTYTPGGRITLPATSQNTAWNGSLLDQVARRPVYLPMQAVAKRDTTTTPQRLVAIDKTALPTGASIDKASGSITTPLPAAVTGIASITRNGAVFANGGQFALAGNSLVINPGLITQPASGVIDTYVVTISNADGGSTLATVLVSHGSVKVDSITIVTIAADTTPDAFIFGSQSGVALNTLLQSGTIMVSGINTAAPISISGGEYSIDGGVWTSAPGTVSNGQAVKLRHNTAAGNSAQATTTLIIGGVSATFISTTLAAVVVAPPAPPAPIDHAPAVSAPSGTATNTTVTETNQINDADGVRNITYFLYQNDGTTLVSSNATGAFTGLTASTPYKMKTTAETYNPVTATWTLQTSPLAAITTAATVVDQAPTVTAPTGVATDTTVTETNTITDADGVRNITYYLYQNDGTTLVSSNATGAFTGLTASTPYKMKTTAETYNPVTATWTLQTSPLAAITTAAAAADITPPPTPATLALTGNAGASAGYTDTTNITLNVANVADPSGVMWFVSESSSAPAAGAAGWSSTQPTSFTLSAGDGTKSVYVYVRDNAATPNVQPTGKTTSIVLDTTPPTALAGNEAMNTGETRNLSVTFNEVIQSTAAITVNSGTLNSYAVAGNVLTLNYTASGTGGTYNNALSVVAKNLAGDPSAAVGVNVVVAARVPPVMGDVPNQNVTVGVPVNLALSGYVTQTNGDGILSYAITGGTLPPGLSLNTVSGDITGTPTGAAVCGVPVYDVTVTASDIDGASNADAIQFVTGDIAAPTGVGIIGNTISWNAVAGANLYEVCWQGGASCQQVLTTSWTLPPMTIGETLFVQASSNNGCTYSAPSNSVIN